MPPEAITVALGVARVSTLNPFKYGMLIIEALSGTGKIDFFSDFTQLNYVKIVSYKVGGEK